MTTLMTAFVSDCDRWQALVDRNPRADGQFCYGVKTTGIYCRPTCASRLPKRENVAFFADGQAAEAAGFRPCKRCQPQARAPHVALMAHLCQVIETSEEPLSLQALADRAGLSPYHLQRQFKKIVGVSPKQYAIAHRTQRLRQHLQEHETVTDAVYAAGFESSSNFYTQSACHLGMTPTAFRQGAPGVAMQYAVRPCWLGWVLVAATEKGISAIALGDTAEALTTQLQLDFPHAQLRPGNAVFQTWVEQVLTLIATPHANLDLPLDIQGTAFQQQVWQTLQSIPVGTTLSYAEVAQRLGRPKAVRAVAQACARNNLAVAIPCHRVVGSDGHLRGYRWGGDRKRALLDREKATATPS